MKHNGDKPRRLGRKLLMALGSVVLVLVVIDMAMRLYVAVVNVPIPDIIYTFEQSPLGKSVHHPYHFEPEIGWVQKPNHSDENIQITAAGFRGSIDCLAEPHSKKPRILVMGDSMVFGFRVKQEDVFTEVLNQNMSSYCFVNGGASGYNTIQELLVLKRHIRRIEPKLVFLFFTQANDMWLNARSGEFWSSCELDGDRLIINAPQRRLRVPLYRRTMIYRFLDYKLLRGRDGHYIGQKISFWLNGGDSDVWRTTRKILDEFVRVCREHDAGVVVIDIPTVNQLSGLVGDSVRQDLLRVASEELNVLYYDLRSHYPDDHQKLFLEHDSHWNPPGHRFIADLVEQIVGKQLSESAE